MARKKVEKNISYDDVKKLYYVTLYFGIGEDGKPAKKMKTFKKLSEARKALKEHDADKTKGLLVMPKEITLNNWLNDWLDNNITPNRAKTTVYGYRKIIDNHIAKAIGNQKLQQLKPLQIQKYYTMLIKEKNLSPNTVRKHHDLLNTALKAAVKQELIIRNPVERVDPPTVIKPDVRFYTSDELKKLFSLVKGKRLEVAVKLGGYYGLRREEIAGLMWKRVDFASRIITIAQVRTVAGSEIIVKEPKNKSSRRRLYIPDDLLMILKNEKERQAEYKSFLGDEYTDSGYVFVKDDGKEYRPNYISDMFTRFLKKHNLPKVKLHELRHTYASLANELGITQYDIGKMLGHSSINTTSKIYTHVFDNTHKEAIMKVADILKEEDTEGV